MPQTINDLLKKAAKVTEADNFRRGNIIHLPAAGKLIATGDIHGHRRNFERIVNFADLANNPDTHVILHEIIHGGPADTAGGCLSYKLLFDVARYKLQFPNRVHTIMGNHDTAFINDSEVMKDGKEMNRAMRSAIQREFSENTEDIMLAISDFLFAQPLAVKCENRIWLSHSLPADRLAENFHPDVLDRKLTIEDIARPGPVYAFTWGRKHSQKLLDKFAALFGVDLFVLGHQAQEKGYSRAGENLLIIASDHNHGCILPIDLEKSYTIDRLSESTIPLTSIT